MASSLLQYVVATPFSLSNLSFILIASILAVLLSTRIVTNLRSRPSFPGTGSEPPVAPYWIPYLQHLVPFLTNPNKTFHSNRARYPNSPFTLLMMNTKFHVFDSPNTASYVFGRSREFVFEPVIASMMENGVNLPVVDRPKFQMPLGPHHALSKEQQESKDFVSTNHATYIKYLTGDLLDEIMMVYMDNFHAVLKDILDMRSEAWMSVDFHELMQKIIFETSAMTFFGARLRDFWPNMWQDWKIFNDATFAGVRSNFSFYLQPRAFAARERMLRAFDKWVDCDVEEWDVLDGVWNEKWGVRMNWEREALARKSGFSPRGRACLQASFLFVIVTNAAPMATCFIVSILESADRLKRFRREALDMLLPCDSRNKDKLRFDVSALKASQFIQGIWKEALRLYSASAAARVVTKDTEIEGYVVKRGSVILLPVQLMHSNPDAFPNPKKFDPERWISDANDKSQTQQQRKQAASLRSFGGGTGLCSGRFVAEQEIISTVATILILFDVEVESPSKLQLNPRSIGIMSPARTVRARLRKRNRSE